MAFKQDEGMTYYIDGKIVVCTRSIFERQYWFCAEKDHVEPYYAVTDDFGVLVKVDKE